MIEWRGNKRSKRVYVKRGNEKKEESKKEKIIWKRIEGRGEKKNEKNIYILKTDCERMKKTRRKKYKEKIKWKWIKKEEKRQYGINYVHSVKW